MRESTFNKLIEEFDFEFALKVVEFNVILKTTKVKNLNDKENAFLNKCKKRFDKKIAWSGDDVDLIADVAMACVDFELKEDMAGLGGCERAGTIRELLKE
jgi:hypothetical protein